MTEVRKTVLTPQQYARLDELDADVPPLTPAQIIALKRIFAGTIPAAEAVAHAA